VAPDRPRAPSGVRVDPAEAAVVVQMFAWYIQDSHSLLGLVTHLAETGVPSPTGTQPWGVAAVRGLLTNPTYTGQIYLGRMHYRPPQVRRSATPPIGRPHATGVPVVPQEWVPAATVPAMITEEPFQRAQAKLATNQSFARRHNTVEPYLLRAFVSCGQCGLSCTARQVQSHHPYYLCRGKWRQVRQRTGRHCPSRFIPASQLAARVWSDLCDLVRPPHSLAQALERAHAGHWLPQELQARCENLRRGHVSLQQQLDRLTAAYLSGVIPLPEYQRRRVDLEQRQAALARHEAQRHQQAQRLHEATGLATSVETFCQRVHVSLETATCEQRRQLVELLIDRVIVTGEEGEIRYVIPTSQRSEHIRFCHLRLDYFPGPHLRGS
jgi:site-specific DNA recombinase